MNDKIWLSSPHMGENELKNVQEAFATNWIAPLGPHVNAFEEGLSQYLGEGVQVAALSAGTAALHLALVILGVQAGDEVICQSMTFSASANPIVYQGATPVFVDSEEQTWNISPKLLEAAIKDRIEKGKKPKAIIIVHLYGMPAQMDQLMEIANRYEIPVVEDAAEALGSSYRGQRLGTFGAISILSFNGNKIITTSGGGALVSKNEEWVKKARFLATQARDAAPHYQHSQIGYNYRMSNICAGIGCGQLDVLEARVAKRRSNYDFYKNELSDYTNMRFMEEPGSDYYSNRWLSTLLVEEDGGFSREDIRLGLEKDNIESRPLWKPMHLQPVFEGAPFYGDGTSERLFQKGLCLPSGSNLSDGDLNRVVRQIHQLLQTVEK
ncbi:aminotransferase class I/II-fold pyridoxal phosphate-dependent enzyme [Pontibacter diazotrophicus]|uniref:GDP-perosamine synthase n=1 Tax=Pontibacter diazotrophicus TaxID=1400979 RepID=A0A3D8LFY4_9BACT|nr:aminotransferase class I/II-fold pyridoxal phosphate-dependent enzyme [Pontibacter diazotrophicus]RDV16144.1 aminotransferase class I/II-fold pyridoxal phosphate-dependent enzyme [Pontibacter diazotrophicus]